MPVMTKSPRGDDIVILSRPEYDQLVAAANEDAADVETLRRSIARVESGEEETFSSAEVDAFLAAKTPLAFFRKKRGISQDDLAKRAGITQGFLSEIEIGRKSGDIYTLRKLSPRLPSRACPARRSRRARTSHHGLEKRTAAHARRRPMKMAASPWRYDGVACHALKSAIPRGPANSRYSFCNWTCRTSRIDRIALPPIRQCRTCEP
jgi:DNA-binding XRE family transcriptional regulator